MTIRIYKMNRFVRLITLNWPVAITIMPFGIFIKPDYFDDDQTIRHEMIHARQQLEMLILFFYLWYLVEWLIRLVINFKMAYMSVSFEREAYRNDENSEYLTGRKHFAWLSYLRQEQKIVESFDRENEYVTDEDIRKWIFSNDPVQDGDEEWLYGFRQGKLTGAKAMRDGNIKHKER